MTPLDLQASVELEVPFHDVDVMHVAWHGHYVKYFELARCALLRRFGSRHACWSTKTACASDMKLWMQPLTNA